MVGIGSAKQSNDRYMFYKTQHGMNIMTCPNNSYNRVGLVE